MKGFALALVVGCGSPPEASKPVPSPTRIAQPTPIQHVQVTNVDHGQLIQIPSLHHRSCGGTPSDVIFDVPTALPRVRILIKSSYDAIYTSTQDGGCIRISQSVGDMVKPGSYRLSLFDPEQRPSFAIALIPDRADWDPLADLTPIPTGSHELTDRALTFRYPAFTFADSERQLIVDRLLLTAPREFFVYAAHDLTDAIPSTAFEYQMQPAVPQRGEPLLWTGNQVITLDGEVFSVGTDGLSVATDAVVFPAKVRSQHLATITGENDPLLAPYFSKYQDLRKTHNACRAGRWRACQERRSSLQPDQR